jgi:putative ABC transport system permease protein
MDRIPADLRYAVRRLTSARAFSAVAVLTLALGIGATTAIYSVVDAILLRPLPYAEPDSLNQIWSLQQGNLSQYLTLDAVEEWRRHDDLFRAAEPFRIRSTALLGGGEPEWVLATEIGGRLMGTLGVPAQIGRTIQPQDAEPGRNVVGVLSDSLWRARFASDPGIVGRQIRVDDRTVEIVGVMPRAFRFPRDVTQLWLPLSDSPSSRPVHALVRLIPGLSVQQAQQRVDMISAALQQERPTREGWELQLRPLQGNRVNRSERLALYVLLGAVTLVLLIACANLANLLLVQGAGREREVAVRAAVGASRLRLVQQFLTETLVLASAGGALGIVVAMWAVDLLGTYTPRDFTFLSMNEISLDSRVVMFAVGLTLLTAVVSGSIPAFRSSRTRLQESLKSGARTAAGSARQEYLRRTFVVAQLALSLMLLVGAGLLARTFVGLTRVDPGFDPRSLLTVDLSLPRWKYGTRDAQVQFFQDVADRLRALPGVSGATVSGGAPPMAGGISFGLRFEIDGAGVVLDDPALLLPTAEVTPDYFALLGIPLLAGRTFSDRGSARRSAHHHRQPGNGEAVVERREPCRSASQVARRRHVVHGRRCRGRRVSARVREPAWDVCGVLSDEPEPRHDRAGDADHPHRG